MTLPDVSKPIAFFIPSLHAGGAQRVVVNLVNALPNITDYPIHIVLANKEGEFLDELRPDVKVIDLGTKRASRSIFALIRYMKLHRPQVMMTSMNYANVILLIAGLLAGRPCRLVVREANIVRKPSGSLISWLQGHIIIRLMRMFYPYADKVVAISDDVLMTMEQAGIKIRDRVVMIGNPIVIKPPLHRKSNLELMANNQQPFICSIGSLIEQKGFDTLLSAFAKLKNKNIRLVILGEGPLRSALTEQAQNLGIQDRVFMPGFVKDPMAVLREAKLFVLSSRWEGFVNVLLEALAVGVPIVSTDCPGSPRSILENGALGHLVPLDDPSAMAEAITIALLEPAGTKDSRMAKANNFSAEKISKVYLERVLIG